MDSGFGAAMPVVAGQKRNRLFRRGAEMGPKHSMNWRHVWLMQARSRLFSSHRYILILLSFASSIAAGFLVTTLGTKVVMQATSKMFFVPASYVVTILAVWILLYRELGMKYSAISLPGMYFIMYSMFIFLGSFDIISESTFDTTVLRYLTLVHAGLWLPLFGVVIANRALHFTITELKRYVNQSISEVPTGHVLVRDGSLITLSLICIAVLVAYIAQTSTLPLLFALQNIGSFMDIAFSRESVTTAFEGDASDYSIFFIFGLPFLATVARIQALIMKKFLSTLLSWILIGIASFGLLLTFNKAPFAMFLIILFFASFLTQGKSIKSKELLLISFVVLTYLIGIYGIWTGYLWNSADLVEGFRTTYALVYERLTSTQSTILFGVTRAFPGIKDFLWGATFPNPLNILPFQSFKLTRYIYDFLYPNRPFIGGAPTVFFAEIYANFGFIPTLVSMVVVGFILQALHILFVRASKTVLNTAMYSFSLFFAYRLAVVYLSMVVYKSLILTLVFFGILRVTLSSSNAVPSGNEKIPRRLC